MSSNVVQLSERAQTARAEDYLGPVEVLRVEAPDVHVAAPGIGVVRASLALAFPYEPAEGDTLLAIGKGSAWYVIGVLHGTGRTAFCFPGDVDLRAEGELRLAGDKGLRLTGPTIEVHAGTLRTLAGEVTQRFTSLFQRVTEVLRVHAGESHTLVDDASYTQARTAAIVTEGTVTINGDEIHLG